MLCHLELAMENGSPWASCRSMVGLVLLHSNAGGYEDDEFSTSACEAHTLICDPRRQIDSVDLWVGACRPHGSLCLALAFRACPFFLY